MSRVLGVDLGERRIGLALSDPSGVLAPPATTCSSAAAIAADDHRAIVAAARRRSAPTASWSACRCRSSGESARPPGRRSTRSRRCRRSAAPTGIEVDTYDERLTTVIAERSLREAKRRRASDAPQRDDIDAVAAAVILQSWLDARTR